VLYLCSLSLGQDTCPISAQTGHAEVAWGYFKPKVAAYKAREHKSTRKVNYMSSGINHKVVSLSLAVLRGDTTSFGHRERTRKPRLVSGVRGAIKKGYIIRFAHEFSIALPGSFALWAWSFTISWQAGLLHGPFPIFLSC
jgi:hypothetical protein